METSLHLAAKEILEKHKKIILPDAFLDTQGVSDWKLSNETELVFDEVKIESYYQGVIPDVMVYVQGKRLMIEITVTHKTSEEKIQKVREQGISILEVNLEHLERDFSIEYLENEVIYNTTNKNWLLNLKAEELKKAAYLAAERKIFRDDKNTICPTESKYNGLINFDWYYCANCEYCVGIEEEVVGGTYDKKGYPVSTVVEHTVYCLGKNRIKTPNELIRFLEKK